MLGVNAWSEEIKKDPAAGLFQQQCANCHDGGKAPRLMEGDFKHGSSDAEIVRSIHDGYAGTGMPAFGSTLSARDILSLVVFLHERMAQHATPDENLPIDPKTVHHSEVQNYRIETIVDQGLQVPWSFVFLPDGRILLTERKGQLRIIEHGHLLEQPVAGVPATIEAGEGGMMSLALDPHYSQTGWIYLAFSDPGAGDTAMTKIVRGKLRDNRFSDIETIFAIPTANYQHGYTGYGCRMEFLGDYLYFSVGDRGLHDEAQKLEVPNGKIHRVFPDGKIPPDNPFVQAQGAFASIWSYGHRNPQGLAFDPRTHALWETEHGPRGGDELNYIEPGKNYGWPAITYGINYDGSSISDKTAADGMEQPILHWTPSIATSQIAFYTGDRFPYWKEHLFLGSLAQQRFIRFEVDGRKIVHEEELFRNLGRIRDIKTGPDGLIYVALEQLRGQSGRLVRLVPAE
jgi:glucose/arabinose dehydrogenase